MREPVRCWGKTIETAAPVDRPYDQDNYNLFYKMIYKVVTNLSERICQAVTAVVTSTLIVVDYSEQRACWVRRHSPAVPVRATGTAVAAGAMGSSSGDDTESGDGSSGSQVYDTTMVSATNNGVPANMHLNPIATQNYDDIVGAHVFERFVAYNFETQEFEMVGLEDWSVDGETFTLTIRKDLNWDNGEPVTAQDLVTQFRLEEKTSGAIWDFAESVEAGEDDKTVVFELEEETNPLLLKHAIGSQSDRIYAYSPVYEEYLDQDAAEVQQFAWEEDVVGNGSFSFESKSDQAWTLTRNEEYYNADNVNFTELQILQRADNSALQQGMRGGELDAMSSMFAPPNIANSMPEHVQEINTPAKWGTGSCSITSTSTSGSRTSGRRSRTS